MDILLPDLQNNPEKLSVEELRNITRYVKYYNRHHRFKHFLRHCIWHHNKEQEKIFAEHDFPNFTPERGWYYLLQVYKKCAPHSPMERYIRGMFCSAFPIYINKNFFTDTFDWCIQIASIKFEPALRKKYPNYPFKEVEIDYSPTRIRQP